MLSLYLSKLSAIAYWFSGVADLKYEFSFVMLNVAQRNEASARFFASLRYAQNDNSYPDSATPVFTMVRSP